MYESFFGFSEKPFKLVPNPAYLFLSKSHEEALAHLKYALAQGDGFVEITGEVGTGKTTLCRSFLENLEEDIIAAYIFNPKMGPEQLIKTINDELGIKYDSDDTKNLIDYLNAFLIRQKRQQKKIILLIDEAQNLSREILEQLRLLSNLETSREKLLQIILVGQPELSDILSSYELRQLGQRITLRYHLSPLNRRETIEYINYRINIAARKAGIKFNPSAFRQIYKYSQGIPRVINIACDRALLTAFGLGRHKITGRIARTSIKELKGRGHTGGFKFASGEKALVIFAALSIVLVAAIFHQPLFRGISAYIKPITYQQLEESKADGSELKHVEFSRPNSLTSPQEAAEGRPTGIPESTLDLSAYVTTMDIKSSRYSAIKYAMDLWQAPIEAKPYLNDLDDDQVFFRLMAKSGGVSIHRIETNMDMLKLLNLPAILEIYPPGSEEPGYLTLDKIDGTKLVFRGSVENEVIESNIHDIIFSWSGIAYLPWKNFLSIWGVIPKGSNEDSIITLKLLLHELGFSNIALNSDYDDWTRYAIEEIQAKYGIPVDGFVGPLTKIILYREKNSYEMPRLTN